MPKFRKKPVVIEAVQVGSGETPHWWTDAIRSGVLSASANPSGMVVCTLEGNMIAVDGDWIIQGVKGELYPCKPDIFEATYEPAELTPTMEEAILQAMQEPGNIQCMRDPGPAVGDTLTPQCVARGKGWLERTVIEEIDLDDTPDAPRRERYTRFRDELEGLINSRSMENGSDTPDFMLAAFMVDVLMAFDQLMFKRDGWYGASHRRLKAQLEAEGSHTEALQAENERLKRMMENHMTSEPDKGD